MCRFPSRLSVSKSARIENLETAIALHGLVDCSDRRFSCAKAELVHVSKHTHIGFHGPTPPWFLKSEQSSTLQYSGTYAS